MMLALAAAAAGLLAGAALGALVTHLRAARRLEALAVELTAARVRLEASALDEAGRAALLEQSETRLRGAFDAMAREALRANNDLFLQLARETFGREQTEAEGALKEREAAIAQLVLPLRASLERTEAQVQALEHERREAFAALRTQIEALSGG
ncbi:MAG TPA: hypothetical protein VMU44_07435, partial [Steroidobacteraceae bacterium]|nr:hypothetical protein [Steroidobacteraceae bacterium]